MLIGSILPVKLNKINSLNRAKISFGANVSRKKSQEISPDAFFIQMAWYRKNDKWAREMSKLTRQISRMMKKNEDFETILKIIELTLPKINNNSLFGTKSVATRGAFTIFEDGRGEEYFVPYKERLCRLDNLKIKSNKKYKEANTVTIFSTDSGVHITYGRNEAKETSNLNIAKEVYESLRQIDNPSQKEILEKTATIRWLINQENPYCRGNESVATVLERAIFALYGLENPKYKKGVSPDFEAFYMNLDDFIEIYPSLFEKEPDFISRS